MTDKRPETYDEAYFEAQKLKYEALPRIANAIEETNKILGGINMLMAMYLRMTIRTAVATYEAMPEESRETIAPMFAELKQFLQDTDDEVESSSPVR